MIKRMWSVVCVVVALGVSSPAAGQAPATGARGSIGGTVGVQAVENVGAQVGGDLSWRLTDTIDVVGEAVWLQDVVTRRRAQAASSVATYLQQAQGQPVTATIAAPAWFVGGGARVFLAGPRAFRPYVLAEGGIARVVLQPEFTLAGADVTTSLPQYGVSLGADLTGSATKPAFTAGIGVVKVAGSWQLDAGVRLTSIQTDEQTTNVLRGLVGFSRRF